MKNFSISIYRTTEREPLAAYESHNKRYFKTLDKRIKNINTAHEKAFDFINSLNDDCIVGFKIYYIDDHGKHCEQINKLAHAEDVYFF